MFTAFLLPSQNQFSYHNIEKNKGKIAKFHKNISFRKICKNIRKNVVKIQGFTDDL